MSSPRTSGARAIHLTPWGLYSRYMLGAYLRHTMMVSAALMTIALTIDLWPQIPLFHGDALQVVTGIAWLALLRIPDLLPPFLPFATFLGVVWSESAFTESRERLLIWNSGRSPLFCLMPALFAGLVMGAALFAMDAWLRPAAIHVQIDQRLGREGLRLDRSQSGGNHWIALPDGLLRAEIAYGPPVRLRNVTVYKLDAEGHLAEVDTASLARPLAKDRWLLEKGNSWHAEFSDSGNVLSTAASQVESQTAFIQKPVAMRLDDLWLRNLGLSPQYLGLGDLRRLARAEIMSRDLSAYKTRLVVIYAEAAFTCVMALLGAALSMLYFAYETRWVALVTVLLAGYLAHFASKAFILMGEFAYMVPFFAGWLAPIVLTLALLWTLHIIQRKRGLGVELADTPHYQDSTSG